MDDDTRGQKLAAMLNAVLPAWARFDDLGDGTLVNERGIAPDGTVNITVRDSEAAIAVMLEDEETGEYLGEDELGEVKWNDVTSIVGILVDEFPGIAAEVTKFKSSAAPRAKASRGGGSVKVKGYTRRFPLR